jgi:hypothetical protein
MKKLFIGQGTKNKRRTVTTPESTVVIDGYMQAANQTQPTTKVIHIATKTTSES